MNRALSRLVTACSRMRGSVVVYCCFALLACGDPIAGTESGNPINPTPPGFEPSEPVMTPNPPGEPAQPNVGVNGPPDEPDMPVVDGADPDLGNESPQTPPDGMSGEPGVMMPPAGAPGAAESCEPSACEIQALDAAARLSAARSAPTPFSAPQCTTRGDVTGCDCDATVRATSAECALRDRFGDCLYTSDEFPGCRVQGDECSAVCQQIHEAEAAEAMQSFGVAVRASACVEMRCRYVLTVAARCYIAEPLMPVDCGLSDDELLAP